MSSNNTSSPGVTAIRDTNLHELIIAIDASHEAGQYPIEKLDAHIRNVQHVAISIFVFRGQHLLLQKRADNKYHSGGLWANTVCSHPRWSESVADCAQRRLNEELGWIVDLQEFGNISYAAQVGELYENEHVHCFFGQFDDAHDIDQFNRAEVAEVNWMTIPAIQQKINSHPETFTEWFKIYMHDHKHMIDSLINQ